MSNDQIVIEALQKTVSVLEEMIKMLKNENENLKAPKIVGNNTIPINPPIPPNYVTPWTSPNFGTPLNPLEVTCTDGNLTISNNVDLDSDKFNNTVTVTLPNGSTLSYYKTFIPATGT